MEGLDIHDALTSLSEDISDPSMVVETVGNLYPELAFDNNDFGSQPSELGVSEPSTCMAPPLSGDASVSIDDDELVDIETVDDDCTMAEKLTAQTIVEESDPQVTDNMNVMAEESACETIETEIVFPEMEHNGDVAHIHQDPNDFQILGEYQ